MAVSEDVRTKLKVLKEKMAARGQEVSMEELIRAHERGISGEKAEVLDGLLQEAKNRIQSGVQSEIKVGKESPACDTDE